MHTLLSWFWLFAAARRDRSLVAGAARRRRPEPLFVESAASTGLAFTHVNGATGQDYMPELMGAGVALFDYDNDGDLDVFLVQSGALDGQLAAPGCRLFRNDLTVAPDGRRTLRFTDVTERPASRCAATAWAPLSATTTTTATSISSSPVSVPTRCITTTATARSPT